jgi:xanthine/uracil/vitamin C permease (AzgA family)
MSLLLRRKVKGSIMIAVVTTTVLSWSFGIGGGEAVFPLKMPTLYRTPVQVHLSEWIPFAASRAPQLFMIFLVVVLYVCGVQVGIAKTLDLPKAISEARQSTLPTSRNDVIPDLKPEDTEFLPGRAGQMVFGTVAVSTLFSAMLGTSPCTVWVACVAGIKEGARTGLAAVVTGACFFVSCFFAPIFQHMPICASAAPAVVVGCLMMGSVGEIKWSDINRRFPHSSTS